MILGSSVPMAPRSFPVYGSNARSTRRWPRVISTSAARSGFLEKVTSAISNLGYAFFTAALSSSRRQDSFRSG